MLSESHNTKIMPSKSKEQALLAGTGITKAGYMLRRQEGVLKPFFVLLNDHFLTFCCVDNSNCHTYVLLTSNTRIYDDDVDASTIRVEIGYEVLILKGKTSVAAEEWKRAISTKVDNLHHLARGHFKVTSGGISRDVFLLLHSECITSHKRSVSGSTIGEICKLYPLSIGMKIVDKGSHIYVRIGPSRRLRLFAKTSIEHRYWVYALNQKQRGHLLPKPVVTPPLTPLHTGRLESLDPSTMLWTTQYVVLTDNFIYTHDHRKPGTPKMHALTPNSLVCETNLVDGLYSFALVTFSESFLFGATTKLERDEWMSMLHILIPDSAYDNNDTLQKAALEREVHAVALSFDSSKSPGICLEARGNWLVASVVSESLSSTVCQGSVLSSIEGVNVILDSLDSVTKSLCLCGKAPLRLSFYCSPQKMGWLELVSSKRRSKSFWKRGAGCGSERVYATLSSGKLSLYAVKRQGKSTKSILQLRGASISLSEDNCFRVNSELKVVKLQAVSSEEALDWATSIAQSISMQNGGGLLLDKEKILRQTNDTIKAREQHLDNTAHNLDEVSPQMEEFAINVFLPKSAVGTGILNNDFNQEWLKIDRVSSVVSDEDIVDAYSDIDNLGHVNSEDYMKLVYALGGRSAT